MDETNNELQLFYAVVANVEATHGIYYRIMVISAHSFKEATELALEPDQHGTWELGEVRPIQWNDLWASLTGEPGVLVKDYVIE